MFSLESYISAVKEKGISMDAVMVIQDDVILALHRFTDNVFHNVFSVAKSYTATAIGFAIEEGRLSLSDKPVDMFAEILPENPDPRWQDVTLFHLLTMTSGHGKPHMMAVDRKKLRGQTEEQMDPAMMKEWLLFAFTRPMMYQPGEKFSYGNLAPYVAGRMLEKAVGCSICDYLYEKMWEPMGTEKPRWDADLSGHTFAASDLFLDIADMAKLGQLYVAGGVYKGRRYLSEEWVKAATSMQISSAPINPTGCGKDEEAGYGYYFWQNQKTGTFRAYGREGQFVIMIPEKRAVIVTQAMHSNVQQVLDEVWEHILPQL